MSTLTGLAGIYPEPVALGGRRGADWTTVHASVSDHGTISLEQDGQRVFLTPEELRALVGMAGAA